jgi:hypothetical protein
MGKLLGEPSYAATHMADATQPEECWLLLQNTLMVPGPFLLLADFPKYLAWQQEQDMAKAYAYYKLQLQILQRNFPPAHWVLKSSDHMSNLAVLLTTFSDACIVQLHRDPADVIPSLCDISIKTLKITNAITDDVAAEIPRKIMDDCLHDLEQAEVARKQADSSRFLDVYYRNLVRDPISEVRKIYEYFGYPFSEEFEARIIRWIDENPKEKHGVHAYSLEQFGLTRQEVRSFFANHFE